MRLLVPPRGRIFDRFGVGLADNRRNYRVVIVPEQTADIGATLNALAKLIEEATATAAVSSATPGASGSFVPVVVRANLDWREMARSRSPSPNCPVCRSSRADAYYPFGRTQGILGYVAAVSDKELTGTRCSNCPISHRQGRRRESEDPAARQRGTNQVEVNAYGRIVRDRPGGGATRSGCRLGRCRAAGFRHQTLRRRAERLCVLPTRWPAMISLVSSPSYTRCLPPGWPGRWRELTDPRNPLSNKAIGGLYPPGSTFAGGGAGRARSGISPRPT